jgi:cell wall-associated NlpC family hydrolase
VATAPLVTAPRSIVPASRPASLSSRSNDGERDRLFLQQLQAQLQRSKRQLNQADADLTVGQKQLMSFGSTLRQAMMEAGPEAKGLHPFVKVAQRYAGTPYVWGGESGRGFDCSGFIIRVMRDLGYRSLPHSAAEQFNYGKPIAQALLKPGDLVFFANTYKPGISHVGIYLGRRRFIHAAGTGLGTIVSSLDTAKYQAKYAGARRLVAGGI